MDPQYICEGKKRIKGCGVYYGLLFHRRLLENYVGHSRKKALRGGSSPSEPSTKKFCKSSRGYAKPSSRSRQLIEFPCGGLPLSSIPESCTSSLPDLHYLAAGSLAGGAPPRGADRPAPVWPPPVLLLLKVALAYITQTNPQDQPV